MPIQRTLHRLGQLALLLALSAGWHVHAAIPEDAAKALLVSRLIPFVTWPESASREFRVGVIGTSAFNGALAEALAGETVNGRPVVLFRAATAEAVRNCDLVVITGGGSESLPTILATLGNRPVLTVSDVGGFAESGGMVGLTLNDEHKLRLRINLAAARAAGLKVSAQLLRVTDVVKGADR